MLQLGSDGRSVGRGSDSGAGSDKGSQLNPSERMAGMYDSLAAELREKLAGREPLLLPPRDYDTMHRNQVTSWDPNYQTPANFKVLTSAAGKHTGCG